MLGLGGSRLCSARFGHAEQQGAAAGRPGFTQEQFEVLVRPCALGRDSARPGACYATRCPRRSRLERGWVRLSARCFEAVEREKKPGTAPLMKFLELQESFEATAVRYSDGRSMLRSRSSTAAPSERAALRRCAAAGVEPHTTASEGAHSGAVPVGIGWKCIIACNKNI